jgi:lysophospholipase L1-like esterase
MKNKKGFYKISRIVLSLIFVTFCLSGILGIGGGIYNINSNSAVATEIEDLQKEENVILTNSDSSLLGTAIYQYEDTQSLTVGDIYQVTQVEDESITLSKLNYDIDNSLKSITCWGDSITAGAGGSGTKYPLVLAELCGRTVYNAGVGGESSATISARQGGTVMLVNDFTIPSTTTAVQIADYYNPILNNQGKAVYPLRQGNGYVNTCSIGGVEGTLSRTQTSSTSKDLVYYFTRTEAGNEVIIDRPTPIITAGQIDRRSDIMIIFIGQNGGYDTTEELINQIKAMVDFNDSIKTEYIVLGLTSGTAESRASMEYDFSEAFGRRYINLREYISAYGLDDAELTATKEDLEDMAEGSIPASLRYDNVHFNAYGYTVIGNLIYKKLLELNIL